MLYRPVERRLLILGLWTALWCGPVFAQPDPLGSNPSAVFETSPDRPPLIVPMVAEQPTPSIQPTSPADGVPQPVESPAAPPTTTAPAADMPPADAIAETPPPTTDKPTVESVQAALAKIKENIPDEAQRKALVDIYEQALADLKEAENQSVAAKGFAERTQAIPQEVEKLKREKEALAAQPPLLITDGQTLAQLQQEVTSREQKLTEKKARFESVVAEMKNVTVHEELGQKRKQAQEGLNALEEQLKNLPTGKDATPQTIAERTRLQTRRLALQASLARYEKEAAWRQGQTEVLPLLRDIAAAEIARLEVEVRKWREEVTAARAREVKVQTREAEAIHIAARAYAQYPLVVDLVNRIDKLTERRSEAARRVPLVVASFDSTNTRLEAVEENFLQNRKRVEAAGHIENIGMLLRIEQNTLPSMRQLERQINERQDEIQKAQVEFYEMTDRTREIANVEKAMLAIYENPQCRIPETRRGEMRPFLQRLLETEKQHLDSVIPEYEAYLARLWQLDESQRQLLELTAGYQRFISEHVLWIRSTSPIWSCPIQDFRTAALWISSPQRWAAVARSLTEDIFENAALWLFGGAVLVSLLIRARRMRQAIREFGEAAARKNSITFGPTSRTLLYSVLIASCWPLVSYFVGWRLSQRLEAPLFVLSVADGLMKLAAAYFPLELFRQFCRTQGLAQAHFGWPKSAVTGLRRGLRWFIYVALPFSFAGTVFAAAALTRVHEYESLGRLCMIAALLIVAYFSYRLFRPSSKVFRDVIAYRSGGWLARTKYLWSVVAVAVPLAFAGLSAFGYQYTAAQLVSRLYGTLWLVLGLVVIDALVQRWLLVTRRRIALDQYRQRREAAAAADTPPSSYLELVEDSALNLTEMNAQTRQLLRSMLTVGVTIGMWFVWVDVLPALSVLRTIDIPFLTIERTENTTADSAAPKSPVQKAVASATAPKDSAEPTTAAPRTVTMPITLADLILALLLLVVTIGAARNLPGLLEMVVLQQLPLDNAARYAITTLSRYMLTFIGITAAFAVVGLRWQNVQWLAAALMLGLGFGLQEIFANFFSGLVVLIERPVRVGDIVTVGDVNGVVSRIRMRATTITNWERKEMIIPNKDLITGRVLNWTLSDQVQRIFFIVGIAYGSDTAKATELLYKVLRSHPAVLEDPGPLVTFSGFGERGLTFEVRCFLPRADLKLATTHELHMQVDQEFREAGIAIAFPQLDLHVRSLDAALMIDQRESQSARRSA